MDHAYGSKRKTTISSLKKSSASTLHPTKILGTNDVSIPMELGHPENTDLIINEDVQVTEYASDCFGFLRQIDNIDF